MPKKKDRLNEIQLQMNVLMEEVRRLQVGVSEGRRRRYPFPFEAAEIDDRKRQDPPVTAASSAR